MAARDEDGGGGGERKGEEQGQEREQRQQGWSLFNHALQRYLLRMVRSVGVRVCIVLRGAPGRGKSTLAYTLRDWCEQDLGVPCTLSAADDFMVDPETGEYAYDQARLGEVHGKCVRALLTAMRDGVPVVVQHNTNVHLWESGDMRELAAKMGYVTIFLQPKFAFRRRNDLPHDLRDMLVSSHGVPPDKVDLICKKAPRVFFPLYTGYFFPMRAFYRTLRAVDAEGRVWTDVLRWLSDMEGAGAAALAQAAASTDPDVAKGVRSLLHCTCDHFGYTMNRKPTAEDQNAARAVLHELGTADWLLVSCIFVCPHTGVAALVHSPTQEESDGAPPQPQDLPTGEGGEAGTDQWEPWEREPDQRRGEERWGLHRFRMFETEHLTVAPHVTLAVAQDCQAVHLGHAAADFLRGLDCHHSRSLWQSLLTADRRLVDAELDEFHVVDAAETNAQVATGRLRCRGCVPATETPEATPQHSSMSAGAKRRRAPAAAVASSLSSSPPSSSPHPPQPPEERTFQFVAFNPPLKLDAAYTGLYARGSGPAPTSDGVDGVTQSEWLWWRFADDIEGAEFQTLVDNDKAVRKVTRPVPDSVLPPQPIDTSLSQGLPVGVMGAPSTSTLDGLVSTPVDANAAWAWAREQQAAAKDSQQEQQEEAKGEDTEAKVDGTAVTAVPFQLCDFSASGMRGMSDDAVYDENPFLRMHLPRGLCYLVEPNKTAHKILCGMPKFTGNEDDSDGQGRAERYFVEASQSATTIMVTEKANGEAAHVRVCRLFGRRCFVVGSKHVHMLVRDGHVEDVDAYLNPNREEPSPAADGNNNTKNNPGQRYTYAAKIATAFMERIAELRATGETQARLLETWLYFMEHTGWTATWELEDPAQAHIILLREKRLKFISFVRCPYSVPCLEQRQQQGYDGDAAAALAQAHPYLPMQPRAAIDLMQSVGFDTVWYFLVPNNEEVLADVKRTILEERAMRLEGSVLYFMDASYRVLGLLKSKNAWYIVMRAIREKVVPFAANVARLCAEMLDFHTVASVVQVRSVAEREAQCRGVINRVDSVIRGWRTGNSLQTSAHRLERRLRDMQKDYVHMTDESLGQWVSTAQACLLYIVNDVEQHVLRHWTDQVKSDLRSLVVQHVWHEREDAGDDDAEGEDEGKAVAASATGTGSGTDEDGNDDGGDGNDSDDGDDELVVAPVSAEEAAKLVDALCSRVRERIMASVNRYADSNLRDRWPAFWESFLEHHGVADLAVHCDRY